MFKRELQVKMVKPKKLAEGETESSEPVIDNKSALVAGTVDRGITKIGFTVLAYVALDTIRKVLVTRASK